MMNEFDIQWEELDTTAPNEGRKPKRTQEVWLGKAYGKNKKVSAYNRVIISKDIIEELGWKEGDRVTFMKAASSKMYAIRRQNEGNGKGEHILRNNGGQLCVMGIGACLALSYPVNGDTFDAWIDNGKVVFKPKKTS